MELWILWLVVIIHLTIIEATTTGLITIWFIMSGLVTLIVSIFVPNFLITFLLFIILGIILLLGTKTLLKTHVEEQNRKETLKRIIGAHGVVTKEMKKNVQGEVMIEDMTWPACAERKIPVGTEIEVLGVEAQILKVARVKKPTPRKKSTKNESQS